DMRSDSLMQMHDGHARVVARRAAASGPVFTDVPGKHVPVEFPDRARRSSVRLAKCNGRRLINPGPDIRYSPSAQIPRSAHGQMNSAFETDRDLRPQE